MIAALYVEKGGIYWDVPDVDPWDEERDARTYNGLFRVVAHPPCKTWSLMSNCRPEIIKGEDGGCFEAALESVRTWGGVLEHPKNSQAWKAYDLPKPAERGWTTLGRGRGWACEVDQAWYGHRANKKTWLYYCGEVQPPALLWGPAPKTDITVRNDGGGGRDQRSRTPIEFRDLLIDLARMA